MGRETSEAKEGFNTSLPVELNVVAKFDSRTTGWGREDLDEGTEDTVWAFLDLFVAHSPI